MAYMFKINSQSQASNYKRSSTFVGVNATRIVNAFPQFGDFRNTSASELQVRLSTSASLPSVWKGSGVESLAIND
jgi:hypothetical protein